MQLARERRRRGSLPPGSDARSRRHGLGLAGHAPRRSTSRARSSSSRASSRTSPRRRRASSARRRPPPQLRSPHVVQILDHGVWEGTPYIAMELLEGEDSRQAPREASAALSPAEIERRSSAGLPRARARRTSAGIVHRDLKPDNIFLVRDDDREIVKILDFGIAKSNSAGARQRQQHEDGRDARHAVLHEPRAGAGHQGGRLRAAISGRSRVIVFQCLTGRAAVRERGARRSAREDHREAAADAVAGAAGAHAEVRRVVLEGVRARSEGPLSDAEGAGGRALGRGRCRRDDRLDVAARA